MSTRRFEREEPAPRSKCISCLCVSWKVFTCVFSHVTLITLVVAYCVAGAFLFEHLEAGNEAKVSMKSFYVRKESIRGCPNWPFSSSPVDLAVCATNCRLLNMKSCSGKLRYLSFRLGAKGPLISRLMNTLKSAQPNLAFVHSSPSLPIELYNLCQWLERKRFW